MARTHFKIRPLLERVLLILSIEVSPSFGIDEAIADSTNSLCLVGGSLIRMESSRHVQLFVPLLAVSDLLQTSLDPPFTLSFFVFLA